MLPNAQNYDHDGERSNDYFDDECPDCRSRSRSWTTLSFDDDDDDQDHLIVHGLGFPLSHSLHNLVRLFRHVGQLQNLENGNYGGDDNNNYEGDDNDDEGDDDDDDDDNRAGKFLHRDAALGLHENTSATLGVHLQFEKGGRGWCLCHVKMIEAMIKQDDR